MPADRSRCLPSTPDYTWGYEGNVWWIWQRFLVWVQIHKRINMLLNEAHFVNLSWCLNMHPPASAAVSASGSLRCWVRSAGRPPGLARDGTARPSWAWRYGCPRWWHWPACWSHSRIRGEPRRCWVRWRHRHWTWDRPERCWVGWEKRGREYWV